MSFKNLPMKEIYPEQNMILKKQREMRLVSSAFFLAVRWLQNKYINLPYSVH